MSTCTSTKCTKEGITTKINLPTVLKDQDTSDWNTWDENDNEDTMIMTYNFIERVTEKIRREIEKFASKFLKDGEDLCIQWGHLHNCEECSKEANYRLHVVYPGNFGTWPSTYEELRQVKDKFKTKV